MLLALYENLICKIYRDQDKSITINQSEKKVNKNVNTSTPVHLEKMRSIIAVLK